MIKIEVDGAASQTFVFPADLKAAFRHYSNLEQMARWLSHISLVENFGDNRYRMLYSTTELGFYRVKIYCDLQAIPDETGRILRVIPVRDKPPVRSEVGVSWLLAQGAFTSTSVFHENGDGSTRVDYSLRLQARLPTPLAARLMPASVLDMVASSITHHRIEEIVDGFIEKSMRAYHQS